MASPELIADVRYSVNVPANTTSAVAYAVHKAGIPRILIEAIFSQPTDEFGQPSLYFGPTYCNEVQVLKHMSMIDWLSTIAREHELPKVDIIEEILTVKGIEELWIYLNIPSEKIAEAIDILSFDANNDERIILVSQHALPPKTAFRTADPTGKGTYILHNGTAWDRMRYSMEHDRTVSLKHKGLSHYQTKTIV